MTAHKKVKGRSVLNKDRCIQKYISVKETSCDMCSASANKRYVEAPVIAHGVDSFST